MFGRQMHICAGRQIQPQIARSDIQRIAHHGDVRGATQLIHGQTGKQVMHHCVADDHRIGDLAPGCAGLGGQISHQPIEGIDHPGLERCSAVGVLDGIADAAEDVLTVGNLRIDRAGFGERAPCR